MGIGKCATVHNLKTKLHLLVGQHVRCRLPAAMQVLAEVERIAAFVCFAVVIDNDDPNISALRLKGLME